MRGKQSPKRVIQPDGIYNSELVAKFTNFIMIDGKKSIAQTIVYKAIEDLQVKTKTKGIEAFEKALENVKPKVEVRSKRVGGSNFQVPVQVTTNRQLSLASRWIIDAARNARKNTEFWVVLSQELLNAYNKEGTAMKKREEIHRMAEANKAFAQFA